MIFNTNTRNARTLHLSMISSALIHTKYTQHVFLNSFFLFTKTNFLNYYINVREKTKQQQQQTQVKKSGEAITCKFSIEESFCKSENKTSIL